MEIAFSGTREGMTVEQHVTLLRRLEEISGGVTNRANLQSAHHGVSGESDQAFHYAARMYHFYIIGHPCDIEKYRFNCICDETRFMKPPLERNQDMIDEIGSPKPEMGLLLATPKVDIKPKGRLGGTWHTIMCSYRAEVPFEIIQRNGEIRYEI